MGPSYGVARYFQGSTVTGTIGKVLKWTIVSIAVVGIAMLGLRSYRSLSGPTLQPWHSYDRYHTLCAFCRAGRSSSHFAAIRKCSLA
jgi:hypothetical protein